MVSRSFIDNALDLLAGEARATHMRWREDREPFLLRRCGRSLHSIVGRFAESLSQLAVDLPRVTTSSRRYLAGEQRRHDTVLVGGPGTPITSAEGRASALLSGESQRTVAQAIDEPLEAHRYFVESPAKARADAINHAAAHDGLPDAGCGLPLSAMAKQVVDRNSEIVIWREKAGATTDDPVTIVVGIAREGNIELVF